MMLIFVLLCWGIESVADESTHALVLAEETDASADNLPCYKITTPSATYFLEKSGGGLSSMLDSEGNDWLHFHPEPGSGSNGEYRGFPNAVHQQAGNYFHARNKGTDPSTTRVIRSDADQITIAVESSNKLWAGQYDFYDDRCIFTMTRMPSDKKYWVLYEGTPGGQYDDEDWWMTSGQKEKKPMTINHEGDIPSPEWMAFGDQKTQRSLVLLHHEDDSHPDRFYQMRHQMTVFGFGRKGIDKYLSHVPQSFSIGFVESTLHETISEQINRWIQKSP